MRNGAGDGGWQRGMAMKVEGKAKGGEKDLVALSAHLL